MSVPEGYTIVTGVSATVTVTANVTCCPSAFLTCSVQFGVLAEVLSNAILYTIDDPVGTPDHNAKKLSTGDVIFVDPARNLRMRRDGTDACVHLQAFLP